MSPATRAEGDSTAAPLLRPLRVVVVDDNKDIVLTTMALLRMEGHETKACYEGSEVLDCVVEFDADAVVLDIGLPGMSGWDVARQIRARFETNRPLLIGITGEYTKGADKVLAEMAGFDYYLVKPTDPKVLMTLLEKARFI